MSAHENFYIYGGEENVTFRTEGNCPLALFNGELTVRKLTANTARKLMDTMNDGLAACFC